MNENGNEINWEDFLKRYQALRKRPDPNDTVESTALAAKRKAEENLFPVKRKCNGSRFRLQIPIKKNKFVVHLNPPNNEFDATENITLSNGRTDAFENRIETGAIFKDKKHSVATIDNTEDHRIKTNLINDRKHSVSTVDASDDDTVETPKIITKKTKKNKLAPLNKYRLYYQPKESYILSKKASRVKVKSNVNNKDEITTKISNQHGTTHQVFLKAKSDKTLNIVRSLSKINKNNKDGTLLPYKSNKTSATIHHVYLIAKSRPNVDGSITKNDKNSKNETTQNVTAQAVNSNKSSGAIHHILSTTNSKKLLNLDSSQSNENNKDETVNNKTLQVTESNKIFPATHHVSLIAKPKEPLTIISSTPKINENNKVENFKDEILQIANSNKTRATIHDLPLSKYTSISNSNEHNKNETLQVAELNKTSAMIHHVPSIAKSKESLTVFSPVLKSNDNNEVETARDGTFQFVNSNETSSTTHYLPLDKVTSISKIDENNKDESAMDGTDSNKAIATSKKLPEILINKTPISFPFEPYQLQRDYMSKVIECLNNSTHGVLESPTGTGKTLSLLCSTLGWITMKKAEKKNEEGNIAIVESDTDSFGSMDKMESTPTVAIPKVIYASRTHSQLEQALKELKGTSYNGMKATIVGSREQLCIHPDVMKETNSATKIHICKSHISKGKCSFYANVASAKNKPEIRDATILDIEDLVTAGRKHKFCPYFMSKQMLDKSDIVFMPYNYLIDPTVRNSNKVKLNNSIVIFDEAHNVEKICEDSVSSQMLSSDIATCIRDITQCINANSEGHRSDQASTPNFTVEDLNILKQGLLNLETFLDAIQVINNEGVTFPGSFIFELMESANLGSHNFVAKRKIMTKVISYITQISNRNAFSRHGAEMQKLLDLMSIVFADTTEAYKQDIARCFKVHITIQQTVNSFMNRTDKVVSLWCFSPNFGIQQLLAENMRCIILTSGTLAPLKPLIMELGLPVSVRLQNPHIITSSQLYVKVVSHGPDKEPLLSTFTNRDNPKYLSSLGRTILSLCSVIPNGLLVFFTSYVMLNKCRDSWQASGTWLQIQRMKAIFVEPQTKEAFDETMKAFYQKINDPTLKGAIFLAILRGKVSEGLDFADNKGRGVMITGLPFPPLKDPRVILKKTYLEENRTKQNEMLSGDEWYFLEAMRSINQAIGRVIRHKHDYGAILLCDQRFNERRQRAHLSSWIQRSLNTPQHTSFGHLITEVSRFFKNAERSISDVVNN